MSTSFDDPSPEALLGHASWLRRLARELVRDAAEADDAVQEVWLRLLQRRGEPPHSPRAWLAGLLRHVIADRRRGAARRSHRESLAYAGAASPEPPTTLEAAERQRAMLDHVLALPPEQRETLLLRYFEDLPPRAIARRQGVSVHTVKSRLQRGMARLRVELERQQGEGRAWAIWLLPLARGGREITPGHLVLAGSLAVGVAIVATAIVLAARLADPGARPAEVAARSPAAEDADASGPHRPLAGTRAPAEAGVPGEILVRLLEERTGAPVPGAAVHFARPTDYDARLYPDVERICLERGKSVEADADGLAAVPGPGPWILHAHKLDFVRIGEVGPDAVEVVLELREVPPLRVLVLDERGAPQADAPVSGLYEPTGGGPDPAMSWRLSRFTDAKGRAWFQDPMGLYSAPELPAPVEPRWAWLEIDLPGFSARSSRAAARQPSAGDEPVVLVLGPAGALQLRVLDTDGTAADVRGLARLRSPRSSQDSTHDAPIEDGIARWPRVAPSGRYEVEILLQDEGVRWSVETAGPAAGSTLVVDAPRPSPVIVFIAELRDSDGQPLRTDRLMAYFPRRPDPYTIGALTTSEDGRLRLELDALPSMEAGEPGELVLKVFDFGGIRWARIPLPMPIEPGLHDLGRIPLEAATRGALRGRCLASDGTPLEGMHLSVTEVTGVTTGARSDKDGRFELSGIFDTGTSIEASDPKGEWYQTVPVEVPAGEGEVTIELARRVRFRSRLRVGPRHSGQLRLLLLDANGQFAGSGLLASDQDVLIERVVPGTYRAELRLGRWGRFPLAAVEDVRVAASFESSDARVDAIDVRSLVREVRVLAAGLEKQDDLRLSVVAQGDRHTHLEASEGRLLLPEGLEATLFAGAPGKRLLELGDVRSLPDSLEIALQPGILVELRPRGKLAVPGVLILELPGHPLSNDMPSIDGLDRGRSLQVLVPAPGRYRLLRQIRHDAGGGSTMIGSETALELEIHDLPAGQVIEIDLSATR